VGAANFGTVLTTGLGAGFAGLGGDGGLGGEFGLKSSESSWSSSCHMWKRSPLAWATPVNIKTANNAKNIGIINFFMKNPLYRLYYVTVYALAKLSTPSDLYRRK
jgi:hypothetical protein